MKIPRAISKLIDSFQSLPGIGPKSAQRLTFHLLHFPQDHLDRIASSLSNLKKETTLCSNCKNVGEDVLCTICTDDSRDKSLIMVVSSPMDAFAMEKTGYKGSYHVLHGLIDPLNSIGPEELFISELIQRLRAALAQSQDGSEPLELVLATNTSMEGESTAMYISKLIRDSGYSQEEIKITRIARGLPVGGDIEYADEITLSRALEGRVDF